MALVDDRRRLARIRVAIVLSGVAVFSQLYLFQPLLPELCDAFGISPAQSSFAVSRGTLGMAAGLFLFAFAADAAFALAALPEDLEAALHAPDELARRPVALLPEWRRPDPPRPKRMAGVNRSLADLRQIDPVGRAALQTAPTPTGPAT